MQMTNEHDVTVAQIAAALSATRTVVAVDGSAEPIVDKGGRQHAPHDGWTDECGRAYRGGEYLPEDDAREYRVRLLVSVGALEALQDALLAHGGITG